MIPHKTPHLETASHTHPGMTGKNNEDRLGLAAFTRSRTDPTPVLFAMVADGVGGKLAGEVAAELAVDAMLQAVAASDGSDPVATMVDSLQAAGRSIVERSAGKSDLAGMGTTVTCAWVIGDRLYTTNVGNSRLYLLRGGRLRRLSIDHSWVQEALEIGILTPEQARKHPNARIITRFLGAEEVEVDVRIRCEPDETDEQMRANQGMALETGDVLLLCTDGLSDVVEDGEIQKALQEMTPDEALQSLTDLANARGGPDNITSVAIRVTETAAEEPVGKHPVAARRPSGRERSPGVRLAIYLFSIFALIVLVIIGLGLLQAYFPD